MIRGSSEKTGSKDDQLLGNRRHHVTALGSNSTIPYQTETVPAALADHSVPLSALQDAPLLQREAASTTRAALEAVLEPAGERPRPVMEIGSREASRPVKGGSGQ
ncbi:hypothetical protein [Achromobacter kerstersii]